jgi:hypothetical protein
LFAFDPKWWETIFIQIPTALADSVGSNAMCVIFYLWIYLLGKFTKNRFFHFDRYSMGPSFHSKRPKIFQKTNETHFTNFTISHIIVDVFTSVHKCWIIDCRYFASLSFLLYCADHSAHGVYGCR